MKDKAKMNNRKNKLIILLLIIWAPLLHAQTITQTIKGKVTEEHTFIPVIGAVIEVLSDKPFRAVTDTEGHFSLSGIPVGKVVIHVSSLGYEDIVLPSAQLVSGKQLVLDLKMKEKLHQMDGVQILGIDRTKARNQLSIVSGRVFMTDEANRYAGSFGDVARMASNYAGVSGNDDGTNDLVIRGNAPGGVLWRIDGVDVFNPNHFGDGGASGGPVGMVNSNLLSNSDFFTSAFPATYGNATAGVFDLYLRNGNDEKHEFMGQVGFGGFELGAEGPFSKKSKASYVVNARYSVLDVMHKMGIGSGTGAAVPQYTDLTAKINIPTRRAGTFSLFTLGGLNSIRFPEGEAGNYYKGEGELKDNGKLGIVGLSHSRSINTSTFYKATLAYQYSESNSDIKSSHASTSAPNLIWDKVFLRQRISASAMVNKKINSGLTLISGTRVTDEFYHLHSAEYNNEKTTPTVKDNGSAWQVEVFSQALYRPVKRVTATIGVNAKYLFLNDTYSIDPRLGIAIELSPKHEVNAGYGHVSQLQPIYLYGIRSNVNASTETSYNNAHLGMNKAHHWILGYQWRLMPSVRLKAEVYYQMLYNIPTEQSSGIFSMLNQGTFDMQGFSAVNTQLINRGKGRNYGIELTLEKFLSNGWYGLTTLSLYNSEYRPSNGHWYNTKYNGNYVVNVVGGKEWKLNDSYTIFVDTRLTASGGQRYTPIKTDDSGRPTMNGSSPIYDNDRAFESQTKDYFRMDIKLGVRINHQRFSHEFAFDCRNVTNRENIFTVDYSPLNGEIKEYYQTGIYPMGFYRIYF